MVNSNSFDTYCGKNWASFSACYACLHGDWRGRSLLLILLGYLCFLNCLNVNKFEAHVLG